MVPIPCAEQLRLLGTLNAKTRSYTYAAEALARMAGQISQDEYLRLRLDASEKRQSLNAAKRQFKAHKEEHGC